MFSQYAVVNVILLHMASTQNVTVGVRVRPLNKIELDLGNEACWEESNGTSVTEIVGGEPAKQLHYDFVFGNGAETQVKTFQTHLCFNYMLCHCSKSTKKWQKQLLTGVCLDITGAFIRIPTVSRS